jgi:hypothetical protein
MLKASIKSRLNRLTLHLMRILVRIPGADRFLRHLEYQHKRITRDSLERKLRLAGSYGDVVQRGPFSGMRIPEGYVSCRFEKTIGSYEAELHPLLGRLREEKAYTEIINVGCAEGYYAVGLLKCFPEARLVAFERSAALRDDCARLAQLNGVRDRLELGGACDTETLASLDPEGEVLLVMDVDGAELDLYDPEAVPWLKRSDFLIELHDCFIPGLSDRIRPRLEANHTVSWIANCGLRYSDYPILRPLRFYEIHALTAEDRPALQDWVFGEPLSATRKEP